MAPCESPATRTLRLQYMCVQTVLGSGLTVCLGFGLGPCLWAGPGPSTRHACFFLNRGSASRVHMGFKEGHTETPRKRDRARGAEPPRPEVKALLKIRSKDEVKIPSQKTKSKYQVKETSHKTKSKRPSQDTKSKSPSQKTRSKDQVKIPSQQD